jgi:hypothetical protein
VSDPSIFEIDHRLVSIDELDWHDRSSAPLTAATGDVGDLNTEGGPVHGVGRTPIAAEADVDAHGLHPGIPGTRAARTQPD